MRRTASAPLLIYHHLPRTGGTSLLAVVRDNYGGAGEVREVYGGVAGRGGAGDDVTAYRDWYRSLTDGDRSAIRCVASHTANLLMPALDRPHRAFCLLRDPAERVWSLYHGLKLLGRRAGSASSPAVETGGEILRRDWSVADIYSELCEETAASLELRDRFRVFFNDQTRRILAPWRNASALDHGTGTTAEAKALRDQALEILDRHYVVGTKERYRPSVDRFADAFGWSRLDAERVDRSVPRDRPDRATRSLILAHNRLDAELHAHFTRVVGDGQASIADGMMSR